MTIWEKIGMLFKTAINKFFTKTLDSIKGEEKLLHDAATITYNIYNLEQNPTPTVALIEQIVYGVDPALKATVETALPKIAANFTAFADDVHNATDINDLIKRMSETIKTLDPNAFAFVTHNIASLLAQAFSPDTLLGKIFAVIESVWQAFTKPDIQNP